MIDIQKKGALFVLVPLLILGLSVTACENTEELVDPSFATGTVVIDISPDDIDAPWELILPDGSTVGGNGDTALRDLAPGSYQLNFGAVPGYGSPTPRSQTLEAGDELRLTGTYVARSAPTGSVDINPDPDEIGAGWFLAVDGKFAARGAGDSTLTEVSAGEVQLIWNPVEGWASPVPNPAVQLLEADSLITFAGTYTPLPDGDLGWIVVRPLPEGIEAPWTLSGPQPAGEVGAFQLPGVPVGEYTIEWGKVSGYKTPKPSTGTLTDQQILEFEAVYEPATGTITIDPTPNDINAPWTLTPSEGDPFNGTGDTTLRDLPVGQYTLAWGAVSDWSLPDPTEETIFLSIDETRLIAGTYGPASGTIVIQASPAEAPWSLTGLEFSTNGTGSATFPAVTPGDYTVTWQPLNDWVAPDPDTLSVASGNTTTFVGAYRSLLGPSLGPVNGTMRNGEPVVISGSNFGQHSMDLAEKASGPNGWIEQSPVGTKMQEVDGRGGWTSYNGAASLDYLQVTIDNTQVKTGNRAVEHRIDDQDPYLGPAWQRKLYYEDDGFDSLFVSWWGYFQPYLPWSDDSTSGTQWKMWWVSRNYDHSTCTGVSFLSGHYDKTFPNDPGAFAFHPIGCNTSAREVDPGGGCFDNLYPIDPFYPEGVGYDRFRHPSRARNTPTFGEWYRYDLYMEASSCSQFDGEMRLYITDSRGRHRVAGLTGLMTHDNLCTADGGVGTCDQWKVFGLQNFWDSQGTPEDPFESADFFTDDIYMQFGTMARVELGDNEVYDLCTELYAQYPLNWSTERIEFELNYGAFQAGETRYLFVVDANGVVSPGRPIVLGSSDGQ